MTREVPARPASWLLAVLLSLGSLVAAEPAHAAKTHAAHQKVLKKSAHARPKANARTRTHVAAKHATGKKKVVARSIRIPAQPPVAHIDGSGPLQVTANVA